MRLLIFNRFVKRIEARENNLNVFAPDANRRRLSVNRASTFSRGCFRTYMPARIRIDLTGKTFGKWTVLNWDTEVKKWVCKCDCGTIKNLFSQTLRNGRSKSCGCSYHGFSDTGVWRSWEAMKARCYNSKNNRYQNYGGRGIKVCDRWLASFKNFLADMGERPEGMTLDRIDVNGDYSKENCKWSTPTQQGNNTRFNHSVTRDGQTKTVTEWINFFGLNSKTVWSRIGKGWPEDKWFDVPNPSFVQGAKNRLARHGSPVKSEQVVQNSSQGLIPSQPELTYNGDNE